MKVLKPYLFVQREDESEFPSKSHYDYKDGFRTLKEAKKYASQCSFSWINHWDVVYARIFKEEYLDGIVINVSEMTTDEQKAFCAENGIFYE